MQRVLADDREQDRHGHERQRDGDQRRGDRDHRRAFAGGVQAPTACLASCSPPCRPPRRRPSAVRAFRAWPRAGISGADSRPWNITAMRSAISASSSRSWLITSTAAPRRGEIDQRLANDRGGAGIDAPGRLADDENAGLAQDFAADDEFLQIAAGEADRLRIALGLAHVEASWCVRSTVRQRRQLVDEAAA